MNYYFRITIILFSLFVFTGLSKSKSGTGSYDNADDITLPTTASDYRKNVISCPPSSGSKLPMEEMDDMTLTHTKKKYYPLPPGTEEIFINDNRQSAGVLQNGILTINLEVREGMWFPETHEGKSLRVFAFAEKGKPLQLPGPQLRVSEGTIINASIHNSLKKPVILHGFCSRPAKETDSIIIEPGKTYTATFPAGQAGTYFYRASASDTLGFLKLPYNDDSQLYGAFIIDPASQKPDPKERIMMIGLWNNNEKVDTVIGEELAINGLTWPFTERLTYTKGEEVNWRVINSSNQQHPMHLHGFYYSVKSKGNLYRDSVYDKKDTRLAVTELLNPGETFSLRWIPEKPGNWLFHCHTMWHIIPESFLRKIPKEKEMDPKDLTAHVRHGMGGLVMGIQVLPSGKKWKLEDNKKTKERALALIVKEKPNWCDTLPGYGFILLEGNQPAGENVSIPGPAIILNRDEPVAIKVINRLKEATTIHWHGLEIASYYDGVSGWGNYKNMLAPIVQPGDSFVVHMRPPRSGTFIYHTHMHNSQLFAGMYGALIVKDQEKKYDEEKNRVIVISENLKFEVLVNGKKEPDTLNLKKGISYRLRLINISFGWSDLTTSVLYNGSPLNWKALAKDGADYPPHQQTIQSALNQPVSIGQTYDFEFTPEQAGDYIFQVGDSYGFLASPVKMLIRVKE